MLRPRNRPADRFRGEGKGASSVLEGDMGPAKRRVSVRVNIPKRYEVHVGPCFRTGHEAMSEP